MSRSSTIFTTIRTEGALLPADLLQRISEGATIDGLTPESYHRPGEKLNEAINRSWNALQGAWASFRAAQERLPADDIGTSITRERWLLPLFRELDYGRLQTATAVEIDGRSYPISHGWEHVPVHLVSYKLDLDKRTPGVAGASTASPHSMLQVYLNRSDANLWGFLSNGYSLRILRDNASLTRQAYVEFDLEAMMTGEVYSDFVLLWLLCHQSRVEGERPSDCWLEKWMKVAEDQGTRALDQLRDGVEAAITALGLGFLEHPSNHHLRDKLTNGALDGQDYYRQLLRLVYRLLFLFVAEDRDLLLNPAADEPTRERYLKYYSTQRLRRMAEHFKGTRHPDLFEGLRLVMRLLSGSSLPSLRSGEGAGVGSNQAASGLGLVPLGSFLFSDEAVRDTIDCQLSNTHLLDAIRALSLTYDTRAQVYRSVDYRNLGPEELGSIYESLLELHPQINVPARRFALATAGGNERKTTGSYYTPTSLINALLDSALDPVLEAAIKGSNSLPSPRSGEGLGVGMSSAEQRILALKICDPACGSGHFLIAAANRMAKALATVRTGEEEPPPARVQEAKRDIIGHCIYGVDINPMAVELCKVNLWMEALEPGKPLNFLDHRIQVGNSLLGTTPALMAQGIPDDAFTPIEGDDPKFVTTMKKLNRDERKQRAANVRQLDLFGTAPAADYTALTRAMYELDATPDDTLAGIHRKVAQYAALASDTEYIKARLLADAWCAAFVWEKRPPSPVTMGYQQSEPANVADVGSGLGVSAFPLPLTDRLYRRMEENPLAENLRETREYVVALKEQYQFFHWHVAFPDVFTVDTRQLIADDGAAQTGWIGGFDCVLGNPPWERINLEEKQFFATVRPDIADAKTVDRRKLIEYIKTSDPYLYDLYQKALREAEGVAHFTQTSGTFPYAVSSRLNTYAMFVECSRQIVSRSGQVGLIVPSGIATDIPYKDLFAAIINNNQLVKLFDFENRLGLFPAVHRMYKFCLLIISGLNKQTTEPKFAFFLYDVSDLKDEGKVFTLNRDDLARINPLTFTSPVFRSGRDASVVREIYRQLPTLFAADSQPYKSWQSVDFLIVFRSDSKSDLYKFRGELELDNYKLNSSMQFLGEGDKYLPVYEAKLIHQFDHRYASYAGLSDLERDKGNAVIVSTHEKQVVSISEPRYWTIDTAVINIYASRYWESRWTAGYRDVTTATNERTAIACILPFVGSAQPLNILVGVDAFSALLWVCCMNSFVVDYVARQKIGGIHLNITMCKQLPIIPPHTYTQPLLDFIVPRVLELTYTAWDLQPFAQDVGYNGAPFIWDDQRRFLMRCELDALYFHLYQINRADVDYIMETFPIVKRKDEAAHGTYRTKDTILAMYDQLAALPTLHVPAPKSAPPQSLGQGQGVGLTYPVPDVTHWQTWLTPPPASPAVAHPEK